jgi:hypothetical protein
MNHAEPKVLDDQDLFIGPNPQMDRVVLEVAGLQIVLQPDGAREAARILNRSASLVEAQQAVQP